MCLKVLKSGVNTLPTEEAGTLKEERLQQMLNRSAEFGKREE